MLLLQNVLYCLFYTALVNLYARGDARNCLFFYPKEYQQLAIERGLCDKEEVAKASKRFLVGFCLAIFAVLILIIGAWNHITTFGAAYRQAVLFLLIVNWYDGIVIDELWVRYGRLWRISGMEGVPYAKPLKTMLTRRLMGSVLYLVIAAVVAGLVVLIF